MLGPKSTNHSKEQLLLPLSECLAKTVKKDDGTVIKGINVFTHCFVTGLVARELINRQPDWLKKNLFPIGSELLAAAHDIGKVSPSFQEKIYRALQTPEYPQGLVLHLADPDLDNQIGGHAAISQAAIEGAGKFLPQIIGRHHGYSPLTSGLPNDEIYGGPLWQEMRTRLIRDLKEALNAGCPLVTSSIDAEILSGLTCIADWISSGSLFEEMGPLNKRSLEHLVNHALDNAGFVRPIINKGLSFERIFGFHPRPIQRSLIESVLRQGAYVLEAPMGIGKTEAALFAAYKALEEERATGIYFALPTQLTSDKIHVRMNNFLDVILSDICPHRKSLLLHGSAWLQRTELGEEGQPGRSWFDSVKRGLLAPFAVGTVDQALMAAMNVRHGFVRTFGLAGKVVILDEVHSYDSYTGTLLEQLVDSLKKIHCTVIILSATLTASRRIELLTGRKPDSKDVAMGYPLISSLPLGKELRECEADGPETSEVKIRMIADENTAVEEILRRAENGEQTLWIENSVEEAQKTFRVLGARASEMEIEYGLIHSRFLPTDRGKKEEYWVNLFGKEGAHLRSLKGRILVGTQVLEQSLDIDADFLVTRLCPTDMLLQRIGRLWRHRENDPLRPEGASRETWVLSPGIGELVEKPEVMGKTLRVYAPYVLFRTLDAWKGKYKIYIPGQIRELLEETYMERPELGRPSDWKNELEEERGKLWRLALIGVAKGGKTLPESKASTRYSDFEHVEACLISSVRQEKDGVHVRFLDGSEIVLCNAPKSKGLRCWRETAAALLRNTVRVPKFLAPSCTLQQMNWLRNYVYIGDNNDAPFRVAMVQGRTLVGLGHQRAHAGYDLYYDTDLGYVALKGNPSDGE